ncbi:MAG: hypothetical protein ACMUIP_09345 [bacterium]
MHIGFKSLFFISSIPYKGYCPELKGLVQAERIPQLLGQKGIHPLAQSRASQEINPERFNLRADEPDRINRM